MRYLWFALLLAACSDDAAAPNPAEQATGIWQLTAANGTHLPVEIALGTTLTAGYLTLVGTGPAGGEEHCVVSAEAQTVATRLNWSAEGTVFILTYPDWPGAQAPVDTATIRGDVLTWHAKGLTDPAINLTFARTTIPVSQGAPPACP
jgi:hypothetical protein